ncbi:MAG: AbrB/MazE/SpoVT family DNA-binding domain-containing protein [Candidatus Bathyarchaeia archaeon]
MKQEQRKVGQKGQVTIPKEMREALKIEPGSTVTFTVEGDKLIVRRFFDAVAVFRKVARSGKSVSRIDPHAAYEEEIEERYQRALAGAKEQKEKSD